jgi:uncharacterized tellurite resistance protein B-like protein
VLSDILFRLPELRPEEWDELRRRLDTPPGESEAAESLEHLRADLGQRAEAREFLDLLCAEDSPFSAADRALAVEIREELSGTNAGALSGIAGGFRGRLRAGVQRVREEIESLRRGESELRASLPDALHAKLSESTILDRLGDEEFRRLSLLGALLGRVAHADHRLDESEIRQMQATLQADSGLSSDEAELVCEIGCQRAVEALDSYALSREFFQLSNEEERIATLDLLFHLAHSDGELSPHEIEEIRRIRQGFLLSHHHFADARVRARQRAESGTDQSTP